MGHRLSRIYTRTGDTGTTGLADGTRVAKHDARIEAIGALDETNSAIGFVLTQPFESAEVRATLNRIQHRLFDAGAQLALPGAAAMIGERHVGDLEAALDRLNAALPPLKDFVLPGGNAAAAACHMARSAARRAERRLWQLAACAIEGDDADADPQVGADTALMQWVNRLSDYLFVAARVLAREHGGTEPLWQPDSKRPAE